MGFSSLRHGNHKQKLENDGTGIGENRPRSGIWVKSRFQEMGSLSLSVPDAPLKLRSRLDSSTFSCTLVYISGPYLTAVDLADIATQLDEDERERMAEGDVTSQDYQEFLKVLPYS